MPELPEVEFGARVLSEAVAGRTIAELRVLHRVYARTMPPREAHRLEGRTVTAVSRRGKHQLAALDDGSTLDVHFGMTGEWIVGRVGDATDRYARVIIECTDGTRITLSDARAFGAVRVHQAGATPHSALGPEPLESAFTADSLGAALRGRRGPIKAALLDQRVVAGLGNIYAAEALWLARISPRARASSLGPVRRARLVRAIRGVLRRAPAARYTNREEGRADGGWRVYDREGQRCKRRDGRIARIVQGGRSTYYCPGCQKG